MRKILVYALALMLLCGCSKEVLSDNSPAVTEAVIEENILSEQSLEDGEFSGPPVIEADTSWVENKTLDIEYGSISEAQKLDIYYPNEELKDYYPTLVYIHGGAFKFCDKKGNILDEVLNGLERGYIVVSINYRLSGEATFPAAVEDCKLAIRFLKANAEEYHIDPENIAVWGESAGGNLAAMVGTTADITDFDAPELGYEDQDSEVKAVVDWFGPLDFLKMDEDFADLNIEPFFGTTTSPESAESEYIGQLISDVPELTQKANPINYVTANDAMFFIQHGDCDRNVPYVQSQRLFDKIVEVCGDDHASFELLIGGMHGDDIPEVTTPVFGTEENIDKVFTWLDKVLK